MKSAKGLTSAPVLPRYHTPPKRPGEYAAQAHRFDTPEEYFKQQYFEAINVLVKQLKDRFEQRSGLPMAAKIEEILLGAVNSNCCSLERLQEDFAVYKKDFNVVQLYVQLQMLPNLVQTRNSLRLDQPSITKVTSVRTTLPMSLQRWKLGMQCCLTWRPLSGSIPLFLLQQPQENDHFLTSVA